MKKFLSILSFLLMPLLATAYVEVDGINYILNTDTQEATVIHTSGGYSGDIAIPATITVDDVVYKVTTISSSAFHGCSGLTSLTIPDGVTSIEGGTFYGCSGLTSLTIPDGVTSIGELAFYGCSGLTSLTIPDGVTSIEGGAFEGCSGLTSLTIPDGVTSIGYAAFYDCSGLTSLTIPDGVTSIGYAAFSGCSSLTSLTIPDGVTSIEFYAFSGCSGLTSLTIPRSVTSIGDQAFEDCSGLTSLTIPRSVTSIGDQAFEGCSGLTSLTIPDGVTTIGESAFFGCSGLTSLTIPDGVTSIGGSAFEGCSGLTSLTIPRSVTSIGDLAFSGCNNLYNVCCLVDSVTQIGSFIFSDVPVQSATLYVPANSLEAYAAQEPWSLFGSIVAIQDSITVENELTLTEKDRYPYYPCIVVQPNANLKVEGTDLLTLNHVNLEARLDYESYSQILYSPESITVKGDVSQRIYTQDNIWYFLSLPFDCDLSKLENESGSQYAIRYYDGASRANKNAAGGNWKNFGKNDIIPMGMGFIFMTQEPSWTRFYAVDNENKTHVFQPVGSATTLGLAANPSAQSRHSGWNLVGNPYANYYSIHAMDFGKAVTVWTGESYEAVFPSDDDLALRPGQAFFVQCPSDVESITLPGVGRQLTADISGAARARRMDQADAGRRLINLTLSDSQFTDKTRVVLNEAASTDYELEHDAGKFMSMRPEVPQLYTLGTDGTRYAINERPEGDGTVRLGIYIPQDGEYTLSLTRNDGAGILLTDSETGLTTDLAASGTYSFRAKKGTYGSRFLLTVGTDATGIATVPQEAEGRTRTTAYYDLSGRRIQKPQQPGVYLLKEGMKVQKVQVKF